MKFNKFVVVAIALVAVTLIVAFQEARADWVRTLGAENPKVSERVLYDSTEEAIAFTTEAFGEVYEHSVVSSYVNGVDNQVVVECVTDKGPVYVTVKSDGFKADVESVSKTN